jgi:inhibitor of cysteine peptidase
MTEISLGPDDDGGTVTAHVGDRLVVTVPENATTGYQWEVESVEGGLHVETSDTVPPAEVRPGQGGSHRVVVRAVKAGDAGLRLRLRRSWEPPERAAQSYGVKVEVT